MLSQKDLENLQKAVNGTMDKQVDIVRRTIVPDGLGGTTLTEQVVAQNVPCRVVLAQGGAGGGAERLIAEKLQSVSLWRFVMPVGTDIILTDKLVLNGKNYEVHAVHGAPRSNQTNIRVLAMESE